MVRSVELYHVEKVLKSRPRRQVLLLDPNLTLQCVFSFPPHVSPALLFVLADKWMFSADHYNFPYPLFVTSVHMLVQWLLAALTLTIFPSLRPKTRPLPRDYACVVSTSYSEVLV